MEMPEPSQDKFEALRWSADWRTTYPDEIKSEGAVFGDKHPDIPDDFLDDLTLVD